MGNMLRVVCRGIKAENILRKIGLVPQAFLEHHRSALAFARVKFSEFPKVLLLNAAGPAYGG